MKDPARIAAITTALREAWSLNPERSLFDLLYVALSRRVTSFRGLDERYDDRIVLEALTQHKAQDTYTGIHASVLGLVRALVAGGVEVSRSQVTEASIPLGEDTDINEALAIAAQERPDENWILVRTSEQAARGQAIVSAALVLRL